jgi:hypothetical protein
MAAALAGTQQTREAAKKANEENGVALAPSMKDRNPWYASSSNLNPKEDEETPAEGLPVDDPEAMARMEKKARDMSYKSFNDPMTTVDSYLSGREGLPTSSSHRPSSSRHDSRRMPPPPPKSASTNIDRQSRRDDDSKQSSERDPLSSRLSRESSERERALALIARKRREMSGLETPRSDISGTDDGYRDVFNREDTRNAHSRRRGWDGHRRDGFGGGQANRGWT